MFNYAYNLHLVDYWIIKITVPAWLIHLIPPLSTFFIYFLSMLAKIKCVLFTFLDPKIRGW